MKAKTLLSRLTKPTLHGTKRETDEAFEALRMCIDYADMQQFSDLIPSPQSFQALGFGRAELQALQALQAQELDTDGDGIRVYRRLHPRRAAIIEHFIALTEYEAKRAELIAQADAEDLAEQQRNNDLRRILQPLEAAVLAAKSAIAIHGKMPSITASPAHLATTKRFYKWACIWLADCPEIGYANNNPQDVVFLMECVTTGADIGKRNRTVPAAPVKLTKGTYIAPEYILIAREWLAKEAHQAEAKRLELELHNARVALALAQNPPPSDLE